MNQDNPLLQPGFVGGIEVANRVVMAPMTRNRADADGTPNSIMRDYYAQRASAGLIVAEGTWPCKTGQAYNRQPGIETNKHIEGWKKVTDAVHEAGGKIVLQVMHSGRIGSHHIKGKDIPTVAPSPLRAKGEIHTDSAGMQPYDMPTELTTSEVWDVIEEHKQAAKNALEAGFDGVELHCTSGYLPMQFLCSDTNQRNDEFGGSAQNRAKFAYECLRAMSDVFGSDKVGLRINPGNRYNDTNDQNQEESHTELVRLLGDLNIGYLHIMRAPTKEIDAFALARENFKGSLIFNDGFDAESAGEAVRSEGANAVSFARHYIANPDYSTRIRENLPLSKFDRKTLYTPGEKGYSDYPAFQK